MSHFNRTLISCLVILMVAMTGFSQDTNPKKNSDETTGETSKSDGLRKISTRSHPNVEVHIDQRAIEASVEMAVQNAMKSVDVALERIEINIEPIQIDLRNMNIDLDPIKINIPNLDINIEPIEVELPDMNIDVDLHGVDVDADHDDVDRHDEESFHRRHDDAIDIETDKDKGKDKDKNKNKNKDKSGKSEKDKSKGLKWIN